MTGPCFEFETVKWKQRIYRNPTDSDNRRRWNGFLKRFMGIYESAEEVLVITHHYRTSLFWRLNWTDEWFGHRTLHLYAFLNNICVNPFSAFPLFTMTVLQRCLSVVRS
jgi:hypothetical protein